MRRVSETFQIAQPEPGLHRPGSEDVATSSLGQWQLTRGACVRPRTFVVTLLTMALVVAAVALGFAALGAPGIAMFCGLQVLLLLGFGLFYALHVTDGEYLMLYPDLMVVRFCDGLRSHRYDFNPCWVHFECGRGPDAGHYWLRYGELRLQLGRHTTPLRRCRAVGEMTATLLGLHPMEAAETSAAAVFSPERSAHRASM